MSTPLTDSALEPLVAGLTPDDQEQVRQVARWACARLATLHNAVGETYIEHALGSAQILTDMQTDAATRCAALLIGVPEEPAAEQLRSRETDAAAAPTSAEVARLVQGTRALLRLGSIAKGASDTAVDAIAQKEMLRKMLLAMAADLRIVLIRLASRLQTLRWHASSKVACDPLLATETLDLYSPLANRLGIWQIKWEMEDLAFRFTDPTRYKEIARLLEEKRVEREAFIARAVNELNTALRKLGV